MVVNIVYAEILAGGKGTRMGKTEKPKQFLMLGNKPMIVYSIEQFLLNQRIDKIIITCVPVYIEHLKSIIKEYIKQPSNIEIVEGGTTRNESVINGCNYILNKYGINEEDVIIIHDSVRPFINQRIINDNIDTVLKCGAVGTVISATDTVFESIDNMYVNNIPNRNHMYSAQSPQSFNIKKLMIFYNNLSDKEKEQLTDSCKIFILNKENVKLVLGDASNIKITTMYDLKVADYIMYTKD